MFTDNIKKIFSPPKFPDDQTKNFAARLLNFIIFIRGGNTLIFSIGLLVVDPVFGTIHVANVILMVVLFVTRWIMHKGHVRTASFIHVTTTFIGVNLTLFFIGGGISLPTYALILTLVVIQAGLLLDLRNMMIFGVLSVTSMVGMTFIEVNGLLPPSQFSTGPLDILLPSALLFLEVTSQVWLALNNIRSAMSLAEREIQERQKAEQEVRILNDQLERRVQERTNQLKEANKSLETFAYSVSHDLRAPLRAIDGFTNILLNEFQSDIPDKAKRYQQLVHQNAVKMNDLIDAILKFSRFGRKSMSIQTVSPNEVLKRVLSDLNHEHINRKVEISVEILPPCFADPDLLYNVYVNLLGNALKYTRTREIAQIEVGSQRMGDEMVYFVRDNGVGFSMEYADRLFGVFQRLHTEDEFEGSGIGLATVRQIITRHNGRIWVNSAEDEGATFYFTMGKTV